MAVKPPMTRRKVVKSASSLLKNAAKEIVSEVSPNLSMTISSAGDSIRNGANQLRSIKQSSSGKSAKDLFNKARESISSGNSKQYELEQENSMLGESFSYESELQSDDEETYEASYAPSADMKAFTRIGSSLVASNTATISSIRTMTSTLSDVQLKSNRALADTITSASISQTNIVSNGLARISEQLEISNRYNSAILEFMNKNMSPTNQSLLEIAPAINDKLDQVIQALSSVPKSAASKQTTRQTNVMDLIAGEASGLNFGELKNHAKNNILNNTPIGALLSMSGGGKGIGSSIKSMIPSMVAKMGLSALIGSSAKNKLSDLDNEFNFMIRNYLYGLGDSAKYGTGSKLKQLFGKAFGVERERLRKVDLSTGKKDEVIGWNGVAQRTLVEVIPGLLSSMEAAITGKEQRHFNYRTGKFITDSELQKTYIEEQKNILSSSMSTVTEKLIESISKANIGADVASQISGELNKVMKDVSTGERAVDKDFINDVHTILRDRGIHEADANKINHELIKSLEKTITAINDLRQGMMDDQADYIAYRNLHNGSVRNNAYSTPLSSSYSTNRAQNLQITDPITGSKKTFRNLKDMEKYMAKRGMSMSSRNQNTQPNDEEYTKYLPNFIDLSTFSGMSSEGGPSLFDNFFSELGNGTFADKRNKRTNFIGKGADFAAAALYQRMYGSNIKFKNRAASSSATNNANSGKRHKGPFGTPQNLNKMDVNTETDVSVNRDNVEILEGYESEDSTSILKSLAMDIHSKMLVPLYANFFSKNGIIRKFFGNDPNSPINKLREKLFGEEKGVFRPAVDWMRYKFTGKGYTARDGTVYADTEDSVFGKGRKAYGKAFESTMQYLLGEEYEDTDTYKDIFYRISPTAIAERKAKRKAKREKLRQEAEEYLAKKAEAKANKAASVGNGRRGRAIGYGGQNDARWSNYPLGFFPDGSVATMDLAGCGPTALAYIASVLGKDLSPLDVAEFAKANGYITDGGANADLFTDGAKSLGLRGKQIGLSSIASNLSKGNRIIMSGKSMSSNSIYSRQGHILSVVGKNGRNVQVYDPEGGVLRDMPFSSVKRGAKNAWAYNPPVGFANGSTDPGDSSSTDDEIDKISIATIDSKAVKSLWKNDSVDDFTDKLVEKFWTYQKKAVIPEALTNASREKGKKGQYKKPIVYNDTKRGKKWKIANDKQYDEMLRWYTVNRQMDLDPFDFLNVIRKDSNESIRATTSMRGNVDKLFNIEKAGNELEKRLAANLQKDAKNKAKRQEKIDKIIKLLNTEITAFRRNYNSKNVSRDDFRNIGREITNGVSSRMGNMRNDFTKGEMDQVRSVMNNIMNNDWETMGSEPTPSAISSDSLSQIMNMASTSGQPIVIMVNNNGNDTMPFNIPTSNTINPLNTNTNVESDNPTAQDIARVIAQTQMSNGVHINDNAYKDISSGLSKDREQELISLEQSFYNYSSQTNHRRFTDNQKRRLLELESQADSGWVNILKQCIAQHGPTVEAVNNAAANVEQMSDDAIGNPNDFKREFERGARTFTEKLKKKSGSMMTGAVAGAGIGLLNGMGGGFLTSLFLPTGPIGGAVAGVALSLLAKNEKFSKFAFGEKDDLGERKGGLISADLQKRFKKALPYAIGGATVGIVKNVIKGAFGLKGSGIITNALLGTGPIGAAIIGTGIGLLKHNDRISKMLFGEKGEDDKYDGTKLSSVANKITDAFKGSKGFLKTGAKGLGIGLASYTALKGMGLIGHAITAAGPIGAAIAGLGIGIASNTDRFKRMLFGTELFDEEGNSKGRRRDGLLHRSMNYFIQEAIYPAKDEVLENIKDLGVWSKQNIVTPFKQAFGPILDSLSELKINLADSIKAGFDQISNKVGDVLDWGLNMIKHPLKTTFKTIAKLGSKAIGLQLKAAGTLISAPLKLLAYTQRKKRYEAEHPYNEVMDETEAPWERHSRERGNDYFGEAYKGIRGKFRRARHVARDYASWFAPGLVQRRKDNVDPESELVFRRAFGRGLTSTGRNKMGWVTSETEAALARKRRNEDKRNRAQWEKEVLSKLDKWRAEDGFVSDRKWEPELFKKRRDALKGLVLDESIDTQEKLQQLMWSRGAWQDKYGEYGKKKNDEAIAEENWNLLQSALKRWAQTEKYNKDAQWSSDAIKNAESFLQNLGLVKEGVTGVDNIKQLMYDTKAWQERFGKFGTGKEPTEDEKKAAKDAEAQAEFRETTSEYQETVKTKFDKIIDLLEKRGEEYGLSKIAERDDDVASKRYNSVSRGFKKALGIKNDAQARSLLNEIDTEKILDQFFWNISNLRTAFKGRKSDNITAEDIIEWAKNNGVYRNRNAEPAPAGNGRGIGYGSGLFTPAGHIVSLHGAKGRNVLVNDPQTGMDSFYDIDDLFPEMTGAWSFDSPVGFGERERDMSYLDNYGGRDYNRRRRRFGNLRSQVKYRTRQVVDSEQYQYLGRDVIMPAITSLMGKAAPFLPKGVRDYAALKLKGKLGIKLYGFTDMMINDIKENVRILAKKLAGKIYDDEGTGSQEQIEFDNTDNTVGNGIGYGGFAQGDRKWANVRLGRFRNGSIATMERAGCGPTALANVANELTGSGYNPAQVGTYARTHGFITDGGANAGLFDRGAKAFGIESKRIDKSSILSKLKKGDKVIISGKSIGYGDSYDDPEMNAVWFLENEIAKVNQNLSSIEKNTGATSEATETMADAVETEEEREKRLKAEREAEDRKRAQARGSESNLKTGRTPTEYVSDGIDNILHEMQYNVDGEKRTGILGSALRMVGGLGTILKSSSIARLLFGGAMVMLYKPLTTIAGSILKFVPKAAEFVIGNVLPEVISKTGEIAELGVKYIPKYISSTWKGLTSTGIRFAEGMGFLKADDNYYDLDEVDLSTGLTKDGTQIASYLDENGQKQYVTNSDGQYTELGRNRYVDSDGSVGTITRSKGSYYNLGRYALNAALNRKVATKGTKLIGGTVKYGSKILKHIPILGKPFKLTEAAGDAAVKAANNGDVLLSVGNTFKSKIYGFITKILKGLNSVSSKIAKIFGKTKNPNGITKRFIDKMEKGMTTAARKATQAQNAELMGRVGKATVKGGLKTFLFGLQVVSSVYDIVKGWTSAEELFGVPSGEADGAMKLISSAMNFILGLNIGPLIDTMLGFVSTVTGVNFKQDIALFLYKMVASDADYEEVQEKRQVMEIELANYNLVHEGSELTMDEYLSLKANQKTLWNKVKNVFGKGIKEDFSKYEATKEQMRNAGINYETNKSYAITNNYIIGDANTFAELNKSLGNGIGFGPGEYSQADPRWAKVAIGRFKNGQLATMDKAGCGPTALTNVANELTGANYNPAQVGMYAKNNGYISDGGANARLFDNGVSALGLRSKRISSSSIINRLNNGEKVIVAGKDNSVGYGSGIFTPAGHIVSLEGAVGNNVIVNDPQTGMRSLHNINSLKPELTNAWAMHRKSIGYGNGYGYYSTIPIGYGLLGDYSNLKRSRADMIDGSAAGLISGTRAPGFKHNNGLDAVSTVGLNLFKEHTRGDAPLTSTPKAIAEFFKYYENKDTLNAEKDPSDITYYNGKWYDQISSYLPIYQGNSQIRLTVQDFLNLSDDSKGGKASLLSNSYLYSYMYDEMMNKMKKMTDGQRKNFVRSYITEDFLDKNRIDAVKAWEFANSSGLNPWNNTRTSSSLPYGIMYGIPYYYMQDERWANMPWKNKTVGESGDDLTSLAMILTAYSGANGGNLAITPKYILNNWITDKNKSLYNNYGFTNRFFTKDGIQLMQETYDEFGKPLRIRSADNVTDAITAMKNHQLVLMRGVQFANSPFGGVGEIDNKNLNYHTVVGTYAKDGMFAVVDPNQSSNAHLIFSEDALRQMIPNSSSGIYDKGLIFSKSNGSGLSTEIDLTNPIQSSSAWTEILNANAGEEFGALKSVFGGIVKIVSNMVNSIFGGTKYKSIFDNDFGEDVATGLDTNDEYSGINTDTENISFALNSPVKLASGSNNGKIKSSIDKSLNIIDNSAMNPALANKYGLKYGLTGSEVRTLIDWWNDDSNSYFRMWVEKAYRDPKYNKNFNYYDTLIDKYSKIDEENALRGRKTNYVGFINDVMLASTPMVNAIYGLSSIDSRGFGSGSKQALSSMRDYYGIRVTDILSGKYSISDSNPLSSIANLPVGTEKMTSGNLIGDYVKQFESGNRGAAFVSSGKGDAGGRSFGTYQFASMGKDVATGNLANFWNKYYASNWPGVKPGANDAFVSAWMTEANRDPDTFHKNEWQYVFDSYYKPFRMKNSSILDPDHHSRSAQEAWWSTAVQYGPNSSVLRKALNDRNSQNVGVADLINTIQDYKTANIAKNFSNSSNDVKASVKNRHNKLERSALLAIQNMAPLAVGGEDDAVDTPVTYSNGLEEFSDGLSTLVSKWINEKFGGFTDNSSIIDDDIPLINDGTKTNVGLVEFARALRKLGAGYVWGGRCRKYTYEEKEYLKKTYAQSSGKYTNSHYETQYIRYANKYVTDCSGILRGYLGKGSNANTFYNQCTQKGTINSLPKNIPGILVFRMDKNGLMEHVGVYTGNNTVVHANGVEKGVIEDSLTSTKWTHWGKCADLTYISGSPSDSNVTKMAQELNTVKVLSKSNKTMNTSKSSGINTRKITIKDSGHTEVALGMGYGSNNPLGYLVNNLHGVVTKNVGYGIEDGAITRHRGTDIAARINTPIPSPISGKVVANHNANYGSDYGNYVVIKDSSGKKHLMAHMNTPSTKGVGTHVSQGDILGYVGSTGKSTGPHLHYEIRDNDGIVDPMSTRLNHFSGNTLYDSKIKILDKIFDDNMKNSSSPTGGKDDILSLKDAITSATSVDDLVNGLNSIIGILKFWSSNDISSIQDLIDAVKDNNTGTSSTVTNNSPVTINNTKSETNNNRTASEPLSDKNSRAFHELIARKRVY